MSGIKFLIAYCKSFMWFSNENMLILVRMFFTAKYRIQTQNDLTIMKYY